LSKKNIDDLVNCVPDEAEKVLKLVQIYVTTIFLKPSQLDYEILREEKE
jgi:hypothetical protein